jgi:hypothetical protein
MKRKDKCEHGIDREIAICDGCDRLEIAELFQMAQNLPEPTGPCPDLEDYDTRSDPLLRRETVKEPGARAGLKVTQPRTLKKR